MSKMHRKHSSLGLLQQFSSKQLHLLWRAKNQRTHHSSQPRLRGPPRPIPGVLQYLGARLRRRRFVGILEVVGSPTAVCKRARTSRCLVEAGLDDFVGFVVLVTTSKDDVTTGGCAARR